MSDRPLPKVYEADSYEVGRGRPVEVRISASANMSSTHNLSYREAAALHGQLGEWLTENRKSRRRGQRPEGPRQTAVPVEQVYPPDPEWGTDERGRFWYQDYDGESLHVWRDKDGELWIDKKGEGPVYVRPQDVSLIVESLGLPPLDTDKLLSDVQKQFGVGWDAIKAAQNGAHLTEAEKAMGLDGK